MTTNGAFSNALRSRPGVIRLGLPNEATIGIRVQVAEVWDAVRMEVPAETSVAVVKERALQALMPDAEYAEDFATKLAGWEILDENESLTAVGVTDGSILLIASRRRTPVK